MNIYKDGILIECTVDEWEHIKSDFSGAGETLEVLDVPETITPQEHAEMDKSSLPVREQTVGQFLNEAFRYSDSESRFVKIATMSDKWLANSILKGFRFVGCPLSIDSDALIKVLMGDDEIAYSLVELAVRILEDR